MTKQAKDQTIDLDKAATDFMLAYEREFPNWTIIKLGHLFRVRHDPTLNKPFNSGFDKNATVTCYDFDNRESASFCRRHGCAKVALEATLAKHNN